MMGRDKKQDEFPSDDSDEGEFIEELDGDFESDIVNPLKLKKDAQYSIDSLYRFLSDDEVELNPPYQRQVVWPVHKQSALIESLYRDFFIPQIVFVVKPGPKGSETRTCVDGKQRLTSIKNFLDGKIPFKSSVSRGIWWYKDIRGDGAKTKRNIIPKQWRNKFLRIQIACVEYAGISESDERDMFMRVQEGVALSAAEKLRAITTPRSAFIQELVRTYVAPGKLASSPSTIKWNSTRERDLRMVAFATYFCDDNRLANTNLIKASEGAVGPATFVPWMSQDDKISNAFKQKVISLFDTMVRLTQHGHGRAFKTANKSKISPIEMVGVAILVGRLVTKCSESEITHEVLEDTATFIIEMRTHLRESHPDNLYLKATTFKTMLRYIAERDLVGSMEEEEKPVVSESKTKKKATSRKRKAEHKDIESTEPRSTKRARRPSKKAEA